MILHITLLISLLFLSLTQSLPDNWIRLDSDGPSDPGHDYMGSNLIATDQELLIYGGEFEYGSSGCFYWAASFSLETLQWTNDVSDATYCSYRTAYGYDRDRHRMMLFGGYYDTASYYNDDVESISLDGYSLTLYASSLFSVPKPNFSVIDASMVIDGDDMYVLGGVGDFLTTQFYKLDLNTFVWEWLPNHPYPVRGAKMLKHEDSIYAFYGLTNDNENVVDVRVFNISDQTWKILPASAGVQPRSFSGVCYIPASSLYNRSAYAFSYGGSSDAWNGVFSSGGNIYHFENDTWATIDTNGGPTLTMTAYACGIYQGKYVMYSFGGKETAANNLDMIDIDWVDYCDILSPCFLNQTCEVNKTYPYFQCIDIELTSTTIMIETTTTMEMTTTSEELTTTFEELTTTFEELTTTFEELSTTFEDPYNCEETCSEPFECRYQSSKLVCTCKEEETCQIDTDDSEHTNGNVVVVHHPVTVDELKVRTNGELNIKGHPNINIKGHATLEGKLTLEISSDDIINGEVVVLYYTSHEGEFSDIEVLVDGCPASARPDARQTAFILLIDFHVCDADSNLMIYPIGMYLLSSIF
eukprot:TRINITY_DN1174_c0_g1_i1.p1 TRINITY_DN1174_c0_g1~~TRINITY_DN1174_c0_g1_i1.p1  ORF type:complete len:584 (-),score=110.50 TRINITY_DN1174_c0_g1_i1:18-1769(-)